MIFAVLQRPHTPLGNVKGIYLYVHSHGVKFTFNDFPLLSPPAPPPPSPFFSPDMDPLKNLGEQLQVNTPDLLTPLSD